MCGFGSSGRKENKIIRRKEDRKKTEMREGCMEQEERNRTK
jgi:hypothetical protein